MTRGAYTNGRHRRKHVGGQSGEDQRHRFGRWPTTDNRLQGHDRRAELLAARTRRSHDQSSFRAATGLRSCSSPTSQGAEIQASTRQAASTFRANDLGEAEFRNADGWLLHCRPTRRDRAASASRARRRRAVVNPPTDLPAETAADWCKRMRRPPATGRLTSPRSSDRGVRRCQPSVEQQPSLHPVTHARTPARSSARSTTTYLAARST